MVTSNQYVVYRHTNKLDGRTYIGCTKQRLSQRWGRGKGYHKNRSFFNDINTLGWDAFEHEVLCAGLNEEDALAMERSIILASKSNDPRFGYNMESGGTFGKTVAESTKIRHGDASRNSEAMVAYRNSEMFRKNIARMVSCKNRIDGLKRWQESEEGKAQIAKAMQVGQEIHKRSVVCIDMGIVFESAKEAERLTGVMCQNIAKCCKGKRNTAGGMAWAYAEGGD